VLAVATFQSVRSANRSARLAERSLLDGARPVLHPSRDGDPSVRVRFGDDVVVEVAGHGRRREGQARGRVPRDGAAQWRHRTGRDPGLAGVSTGRAAHQRPVLLAAWSGTDGCRSRMLRYWNVDRDSPR
jgi:hypothetical protein